MPRSQVEEEFDALLQAVLDAPPPEPRLSEIGRVARLVTVLLW